MVRPDEEPVPMAHHGTARAAPPRGKKGGHRPAPEPPDDVLDGRTAGTRTAGARPLTDRVLAVLPGPRPAWMLAWALVPWLNLAVVLTAEELGWAAPTDHSTEAVNRVAVSSAILLALWGATRISAELARLRPALAEVVEEELPEVERLFRGVDSVAVPLLLTVAVGALLPLDEASHGEWTAAAVQGATWLVIGVPLCTAVWVYAALQWGLHRLGRGQLTLVGYRGDRALGLQSVGSLAFTAFWMLLGALTPLALTGAADRPAVLVTTAVLLASVALFFLSLRGLHRQMAAIKHTELDRARALYQEAYQPLQQDPTLARLQQQVAALNAAEALEKRAERIQAWPFDEGTFARIVTIATSAVATIIARVLLAPTGL